MDMSAILASHWLGVLATTGNLGLVVLILRRGRRNPLRLSLLLLCGTMTVWSFAAAVYDVFGGSGWHWLEGTISPLMIPVALHVVLAFVGRRRRHIAFLVGVYLYFAALSVTGGVWLFSKPPILGDPLHQTWSLFFLAGALVPLAYVIYRLTRHSRAAVYAEEATRARLIMGGLVAGMLLGSTELINNFLPAVPDMGHLGTFVVTATLTVVTLRFRLLDYEAAVGTWLIGTSVALAAVSGYLVFGGASRMGFALFAAAALAFVGVVAFREVVLAMLRRRERVEEYATLGRFSAQMAHDLKNPLAALKGALQFVEADFAERGEEDENGVLELMSEQVGRIESIVDRYQRMSKVEPRMESFDLKAVCERQVRALRVSHPGVEFIVELQELPKCRGDEELVTLVVENLVKNAAEANSSRVELSAETGWNRLTLRISDDGDGMAVRDIERAFDDFYTTKATGTGLGLGFARRVVEAHEGTVELQSTVDVGTEVSIHLPT